MLARIIHWIAFLLIASSSYAEGISAQLSDQTARFFYSTQMWGQQAGPVELEIGVMFTEDEVTKDDTVLGNLGVLVRNDTMDSPIIISIGARGYYADVNNRYANIQVTGLGLGGEILMVPDTMGGLGLGLGLFIAPEVVTGLDAEGLYEYHVKLDYQVTPQSSVYAGYERIVAEVKGTGQDVTIESGFFFGVSLRY